jgi:hypothetical protein
MASDRACQPLLDGASSLPRSVSGAVHSRDGPLEACRSARDRCRRSGRHVRRLHSRLARRIGGALPCDRPPRWRRDSQTGGSDSLRGVTRGRSTESVLYTPRRWSAPGHLLPGRCPRLATVPWARRAAKVGRVLGALAGERRPHGCDKSRLGGPYGGRRWRLLVRHLIAPDWKRSQRQGWGRRPPGASRRS